MEQVDITITGDPQNARDLAAAALASLKFRVTWSDSWSATAERGNKVLNAFAGALAQYFKVGLKLFNSGEGETIVQLRRESRGLMGGAIGVMRTNKNMARLREDLIRIFTEQGVLLRVADR